MNVTILNGSPRDGNTLKMLKRLSDGVQTAHNVSFINLYDYPLKPCRNCDACLKTGRGCVYNDGSDDINQAILDSDVVVFGTPVYYWGMTAQMKLLIDKFYPVNDKLKQKRLKVIVIATGGSDRDNVQYRLIDEQFRAICEYLHWEYVKYIAVSAYGPDDVLSQKNVMEQMKDMDQFLQ